MKRMVHKALFPLLALLAALLASGPLSAQVYKTVDEHGNVTYTDRPPSEGAAPVELRPLSVIEAPKYESAPRAEEKAGGGPAGETMSLAYLRTNYRDFTIVAPKPEETFWSPVDGVTFAWDARYRLQEGMKVSVSVDGQPVEETAEQVISLEGLERGQHAVTAELRDAQDRKVATAGPVNFFVRWPGLYNAPGAASPDG